MMMGYCQVCFALLFALGTLAYFLLMLCLVIHRGHPVLKRVYRGPGQVGRRLFLFSRALEMQKHGMCRKWKTRE